MSRLRASEQNTPTIDVERHTQLVYDHKHLKEKHDFNINFVQGIAGVSSSISGIVSIVSYFKGSYKIGTATGTISIIIYAISGCYNCCKAYNYVTRVRKKAKEARNNELQVLKPEEQFALHAEQAKYGDL